MASCSDSSGNTTCTLTITVGTTSQSDNSTPISWVLTGRDSFGASFSGTPCTGTVTVNSVHYDYSYSWSSAGTQTRTLESHGTISIPHNSDGSKTLTFGFTFGGIPGTSVGSMSATGSVTLPAVKPGSPSKPTIGTKTQTTVAITWSAGDGSTPSSYTLEYDTDSAFGSPSSTTSTTTSKTLTVTSGATWYFRVKATNASGSSNYGSSASALTLPATPAAPTLSTPQPGQLTVSWAAVASATSYYVDYSTSSSFATYTRVTVSGATSTTLTLSPGLYYVRVTAHNGSGDSPASPSANQQVFAGGKRYNGTTFVTTTTAKRWNGNSWVNLTTAKRWNGTAWVNVS